MHYYKLDSKQTYSEIRDRNQANWFHVVQPNEEEQAFLREKFGLPHDFIHDALDRYEAPRYEKYETEDGQVIRLYLMLYPKVKKVLDDYDELQTVPLALIVTQDCTITICSEQPFFLDHIVRNETNKEGKPLTGKHVILDIIWELTQSYVVGTEKIDKHIDEMEQNVTNSTKNHAFNKLIAIHKNLVYFDTGITENDKIIHKIMESDVFADDKIGKELLHDIKVISNQATTMVHEADEMISHLSEVFSSVISNNLNNIMKVLTSLTIILTIPTIIGGLWGMNVPVPFEENPFGFTILILLTIIVSIITLFWLKKKDYF